jgi:hypothetical protein
MARTIDYYPRCFRYCEVPVFQGSRLLAARDDIEYQFYLEWLAKYLDGLKYEVPDCQLELCAWANKESPDTVSFHLGFDGFYHLHSIESLTPTIEAGSSYLEAVNSFRKTYEEMVKDLNYDFEIIDSFDTWINPRMWQNAKREMLEEKLFANGATHADLGYRIPMAIAIKRLHSLKEKYEFLDSFYDHFNEEALK